MLAIATAALLVFSATVEAATSKYDYGGREKYKHEYHGSYKPFYKHGAYESEHMRGDGGYEDYSYEPSYASPYADREYRDPRHDSHDEDQYDRDVYFEEPSYDYESSPAKRYTRSVKDQMGVREDQVLVPLAGKIGKKLRKILKVSVLEVDNLKHKLKKIKRSVEDKGVAREVQSVEREGLSAFGCCRQLEVRSARNWNRTEGVTNLYPELFQTYNLRTGIINGRDHWVSDSNEFAIWRSESRRSPVWVIGNLTNLGLFEGYIAFEFAEGNLDCPDAARFGSWAFFIPSINQPMPAQEGIKVFCVIQ